MYKNLYMTLIAAVLFLSTFSEFGVAAENLHETAPFQTQEYEMENALVDMSSRYISPCRYWTYSNEARGYVCNSYESNIEIIDGFEQRRINQDLERRIKNLETRLTILESR